MQAVKYGVLSIYLNTVPFVTIVSGLGSDKVVEQTPDEVCDETFPHIYKTVGKHLDSTHFDLVPMHCDGRHVCL